MKRAVKSLVDRVARTRTARSLVEHLIYPSVVDCLRDEVRTGRTSPSGYVEQLAWKLHSYEVLDEELLPTGKDCSHDGMRSDTETRVRLIDCVYEQCADVPGDVLEFGVYKGESLGLLADRFHDRQVYGFDSFDGLPEDWWRKPKGTFRTTPPEFEKENVTLVQGLFRETIPTFLEGWSGRACLIHIDCVLYESTLDCLVPLLSRCQTGTVILFDEYYNYADFAAHEWLAWRQTRSRYGLGTRCVAFDGKRAAFEITDLGRLADGDG